MVELIFALLCGVLYVIGLIFGLSYEQISVIICIYACPIICIICAFVTGFVYRNAWKGRIGKAFNYALGIVYIFIAKFYWEHYSGNTHEVFMRCMYDLRAIAKAMNCTYEQINIDIYCHLFFGIIFFHLAQIILVKWRRKRLTAN